MESYKWYDLERRIEELERERRNAPQRPIVEMPDHMSLPGPASIDPLLTMQPLWYSNIVSSDDKLTVEPEGLSTGGTVYGGWVLTCNVTILAGANITVNEGPPGTYTIAATCTGSGPSPSDAEPTDVDKQDGAGSSGTSADYSRADHKHEHANIGAAGALTDDPDSHLSATEPGWNPNTFTLTLHTHTDNFDHDAAGHTIRSTSATGTVTKALAHEHAGSDSFELSLNRWIRCTGNYNGKTAGNYLSTSDWRGRVIFAAHNGYLGTVANANEGTWNAAGMGSFLATQKRGSDFGDGGGAGTDTQILLVNPAGAAQTLEVYLEEDTGKLYVVTTGFPGTGDELQVHLCFFASKAKSAADEAVP